MTKCTEKCIRRKYTWFIKDKHSSSFKVFFKGLHWNITVIKSDRCLLLQEIKVQWVQRILNLCSVRWLKPTRRHVSITAMKYNTYWFDFVLHFQEQTILQSYLTYRKNYFTRLFPSELWVKHIETFKTCC